MLAFAVTSPKNQKREVQVHHFGANAQILGRDTANNKE